MSEKTCRLSTLYDPSQTGTDTNMVFMKHKQFGNITNAESCLRCPLMMEILRDEDWPCLSRQVEGVLVEGTLGGWYH